MLTDPSRRTSKTSARRYLLSGIAQCGACFGPLRRTVTTQGHGRYWCAACHKIAIAQEALDAFVTAAVVERLKTVPKPTRKSSPAEDFGTQIRVLEQRLVAVNERAADLDNAEDLDTLLSMAKSIRSRRSELQTQQAASLDRRVINAYEPDAANQWESLPLDRQRSLVRATVATLVIRSAGGANRF